MSHESTSGGDLVAEVLHQRGVRFLFTLCGGHISPILVAAKKKGIRVIDVRDEVTAVFAADAVARLTGIPGVAAVTAGPGVTNTITAVYNARMAESPLIVLGGATATVLKGRGSLQDIDQMAMIRPAVKAAHTSRSVRALVTKLEESFDTAQDGVPGPVFVECPVDLLYDEKTVREWYAKEGGKGDDLGSKAIRLYLKQHLFRQFYGADGVRPSLPEAANVPTPGAREIDRVVAALEKASQPVLVVGSQTMLRALAADDIAAAVKRLGIPVFLGGMARGLLGAKDPIQFRHARGKALKAADLVIVCGFPMDFRLGYGQGINRNATVITVNRDRAALSKNRAPTFGVQSDAGLFLERLSEKFTAGSGRWEPWFGTLRESEAQRDAEIEKQAAERVEGFVNPIHLAQEIEKAVAPDGIFVVDGGDVVATASYVVRPRGPLAWLDPGVFGTLGVGAGFALAAGLCRPGREVWLIYGDGACGYSLMELDSFVRHNVPVIAVIGNNGSWAQIARDQIEILKDDVGTPLVRNDYHKVAEGWGAKGLLLDDANKVAETLAEAKRLFALGHPVVINCQIKDTEFRKGSMSM